MKKPIRLGLIGCGGIVQKTHARAYHSLTETIKITALADVVTENLQKVGDDFDVSEKHRYADGERYVGKGDIDAVTMLTASLHAESGKDSKCRVQVISEKAYATSLRSRYNYGSNQNYDVPYTVVHNYLYNAGMQTAMHYYLNR